MENNSNNSENSQYNTIKKVGEVKHSVINDNVCIFIAFLFTAIGLYYFFYGPYPVATMFTGFALGVLLTLVFSKKITSLN